MATNGTEIGEISVEFYRQFMANVIKLYSSLKEKYTAFKASAQEEDEAFYTLITQHNVPAIELAMLSTAYNLDNYEYSTFDTWIRSNSAFINFVRSFETAVGNTGEYSSASLSAYLLAKGEVVSPLVSEIYNIVRSQQLYSYNVGCTEEVSIGTLSITDNDGTILANPFERDAVGIYTGNYSSSRRYAETETARYTAPANVKIVGNASNIFTITGYGLTQDNTIGEITETIEVVPGENDVITQNKYIYITDVEVESDGIAVGEYTFTNIPYDFTTQESSSSSDESATEEPINESSDDSSESTNSTNEE